ncbi:hypothetical protein WMY93_000815 [Mugilogobius chulae]|uniref:SH2 domain-containing protein n=1 Tax=Mugilogobius chulae TaxID=88201 RepID=A0AAW0QB00_9GOBI
MELEGDLIATIYYGHISSQATEQLLERFGRDGSFLLRIKNPFVHTYRLVHSSDGWSLQGQSRHVFNKLQTLIEHYRTRSFTDRPTVLSQTLWINTAAIP